MLVSRRPGRRRNPLPPPAPAPGRPADRWGGAALYDTVVSHVRRAPVRNAFRYRSCAWLVDLDALPRPPRWLRALADFRAADHLGRPDRSIRANVEAFLADRDIACVGRIQMLANPRVLGYVFNPLTVFWCWTPEGELAAVIAEVHNTYGERHAYLLSPDPDGVAEFDKEFYVSPFYPVDGRYRMAVPPPGQTVDLSVQLLRPGGELFSASVRGRRRPAGVGTLLRSTLRVPGASLTVAAQIRWQGLRLWWRGVAVQPRPPKQRERGV